MYLESGIAFLDDDYWTDSYNLALHLFKNSAFVQCAQGNMDLMKERLDEVLENARCFEDKLDTLNLMIHSSTIMASGVGQAFEQSFSVLEQLGESFPTSPDNKTIANELFNAKNQLEQYRPSAVSKLQPINNLQKAKAMVRSYLSHFIGYFAQQSESEILPTYWCAINRRYSQH